MRVLILQQAERKYDVIQRRKRAGARTDVGPPFDPTLVKISRLEQQVRLPPEHGWIEYMRLPF
eukprot:4376274-Pleurochrysis_carterae.AAC.1